MTATQEEGANSVSSKLIHTLRGYYENMVDATKSIGGKIRELGDKMSEGGEDESPLSEKHFLLIENIRKNNAQRYEMIAKMASFAREKEIAAQREEAVKIGEFLLLGS